jgi:hypothetical protein
VTMFADAGTLEPGPCTGYDAEWCPVHGSCTCPDGCALEHEIAGCPLHDLASGHAGGWLTWSTGQADR